MLPIRTIADLQNGEAAYTPTHAAWVSGGEMYLNGKYPIKETGEGSYGIRLIKDPAGRLFVYLSQCPDQSFSAFPAFAGGADPVHVDEMLPFPQPDASCHRIVDMAREETAYISPSDVWVYDNRRMWLNGYTAVSRQLSAETPLCLRRLFCGYYAVDLTHCPDVEWAIAYDGDRPNFPIQVLRRLR